MPEQTDLWFRDASKTRNKWHRLFRIDTGTRQYPEDRTACGFQLGPPVVADAITRVPAGQKPKDEFGVCLHCLRYSEMSERIHEKERRNA